MALISSRQEWEAVWEQAVALNPAFGRPRPEPELQKRRSMRLHAFVRLHALEEGRWRGGRAAAAAGSPHCGFRRYM